MKMVTVIAIFFLLAHPRFSLFFLAEILFIQTKSCRFQSKAKTVSILFEDVQSQHKTNTCFRLEK